MNLSHTYVGRQPRASFWLAWHGVALFCFLLLSANIACAVTMSFPEKATATITSIDASSGVIFAKDRASGQVFQFKLTNPALLKSLSVGQLFFVDIANKLVSFDGSRINGNIVGLGPVDGVKPVGPVDGAKPAGLVGAGKQFGPTDGAKPAGPVDGVRPVGPVDGAKPFGPIDGVKPAGPVDAAKPLGPVDGVKAAQFSDGGVASCTITSIDNNRGLITARDSQTGRAFQFQPSNASFFQSLSVGQPVIIEFATNQVSLTMNGNRTVIGSIVSAGPVDGGKPLGPVDGAKPAGPVDGAHPAPFNDGGVASCTITSIDSSRGLITARDNQTGRTFQFKPSNASFFQSLNVGQPVIIEFATNQVSLMMNGNRTVIGSIVSTARSATQK